jgi:NDP-sugar pyrophosphorylase family protein
MNNKNIVIHPLAYIEDNVEIGENTKIGPFCIIRKGVKIGKNCSIPTNLMHCKKHKTISLMLKSMLFLSILSVIASIAISTECLY